MEGWGRLGNAWGLLRDFWESSRVRILNALKSPREATFEPSFQLSSVSNSNTGDKHGWGRPQAAEVAIWMG